MFPNLKADQIIALNITQESDSIPFPMKDVFVKAACHLNRGGTSRCYWSPNKSIKRS